MKNTINTLVLLMVLAVSAVAQEYGGGDKGQLYLGVTNVSVPFDNIQGVNGKGQFKIVRLGPVQINGAGDFAVFFPGGDVELYTFQAGPRVGLDLGKYVTLYGEMHFGAFTTFNGDGEYAYMPGGGIQVKITKIFFVEGGYGRQFIQDAPFSFNRLTFGGGIRFK